MTQLAAIEDNVAQIAEELVQAGNVKPGHIVVIGASTSEVIGRKIGTSGTQEAAERIYAGIRRVADRVGFYPVFQCCEHLNRALVAERELLERYPLLQEVAAVPVPKAGGAMAAYAYRRLNDPCLVETIEAHAGIDIGDTLIGMHLRRVAVPFRPTVRSVGEAHVTAAYTRPKLIGGARAVYARDAEETADCRS